MIPTTVSDGLISGVVGTLSHWGPMRVVPIVINSANVANNIFGRAFTYNDEDVESAQAGGSGTFAGLLVHPEAHKIEAQMPNGYTGEFMIMGEGFFEVEGAATAGFEDPVYYVPATGVLTTVATDNTLIPNAVISRHLPSAATPNLVMLRLTN